MQVNLNVSLNNGILTISASVIKYRNDGLAGANQQTQETSTRTYAASDLKGAERILMEELPKVVNRLTD